MQTYGRTDLAVELRENIQEKEEKPCGILCREEVHKQRNVRVSTVVISQQEAAKEMGRQMGTYITVEAPGLAGGEESLRKYVAGVTAEQLKKLIGNTGEKCVLVAGLGNRDATPDALGPMAIGGLVVTRHLILELGKPFQKKYGLTSFFAVAAGVLAQTGMESGELIKSIVRELSPDLVIAIDSLASRSTKRLGTTIQLTDTGIYPGAGIGNNRQALNKETLGVPVIAIGVPTVVDAATIVRERLTEAFRKTGITKEEAEDFFAKAEKEDKEPLFVTPKGIDDLVRQAGETIADAINQCFCKELI